MELSENIGKAYKEGLFNEKRNYLALFIKNFTVKKGKIINFALNDNIKPLIKEGSVRVSPTMLPTWDTKRTEAWVKEFLFNNSSNL